MSRTVYAMDNNDPSINEEIFYVKSDSILTMDKDIITPMYEGNYEYVYTGQETIKIVRDEIGRVVSTTKTSTSRATNTFIGVVYQ